MRFTISLYVTVALIHYLCQNLMLKKVLNSWKYSLSVLYTVSAWKLSDSTSRVLDYIKLWIFEEKIKLFQEGSKSNFYTRAC